MSARMDPASRSGRGKRRSGRTYTQAYGKMLMSQLGPEFTYPGAQPGRSVMRDESDYIDWRPALVMATVFIAYAANPRLRQAHNLLGIILKFVLLFPAGLYSCV